MRTKVKLIGATLALVLGGVMLATGDPLGDDPDHGKKQILLVASGSEDRVYVFAQVVSTTRGMIYKHPLEAESEPWSLEFTVDEDEVLKILLTAGSYAPRVIGHKVHSACRIVVNGLGVGRGGSDREELTVRDPDTRSVQSQCEKIV